ncbi:MAG TPA: 16S rRNA (adenine(1518)-N(6)/adenine(1519)-N(6))-dimethyltransferase RsmA [Beijerinckiaceae bacterium]|nr:16S rRNA (adenine(1518)-N(6)/adenine(1519)-N(6))-dimethyltransferase RsmA [Beijerinckiaceae bacterium]
MNAIDGLPPLREIVRRYDLSAKKSLGQNFLFDLNLTNRIARAAGPLEGVSVVEVGPGPGGLTRALLASGAARVVAIERDERCLAALAEIADHYPGRLEIIAADALACDMAGVVAAAQRLRPVRVVANLPYNIGTALLTRWVESEPWPPWFDRLVLMFQREVAERIVATPNERSAYGRLGVLCGWRMQSRILFDVPPSAFTPPPKIVSSVVELVPRPAPLACEPLLLSIVTQAAFGQRRKMLRQSLKGLASARFGADVAGLLAAAGIDPTSRAEQIDVAGFVRLARMIAG